MPCRNNRCFIKGHLIILASNQELCLPFKFPLQIKDHSLSARRVWPAQRDLLVQVKEGFTSIDGGVEYDVGSIETMVT